MKVRLLNSWHRMNRPPIGWVLFGLLTLSVGAIWFAASQRVTYHLLRRAPVPTLKVLVGWKSEPLTQGASPLTPALRRQGYNECNPFDFVGLGPYAPYRKLRVGRIAIPQRGGHTKDFGYDVLVHFHGHNAMRMTLAQVAKGVSFVGIDLGNGSGPYSDEFASPDAWPALRESIENALRAHSQQPKAHIRHLGLMAWSAGYGAVNEILKRHAEQIDAVVLLDGLHAGWDPSRTTKRSVNDVAAGPIQPTLEYARRAALGEKLFIFSHSEIDPVTYPSTSLTAQFLLRELEVPSNAASQPAGNFGLLSSADQNGLHVWSYAGNDKPAHCTHLGHVERVVREILEPAWQTPAMDRNVPFTPAPKLGAPAPAQKVAGARRGGVL